MENACETYYQNANLSLGVVYINFLIANCLEGKGEISGIVEKGGVDELLQVLTEEYLADSLEIVLLYDESWDISDIIMKLTVTTNKAFVSYFLPLNEEIGQRIRTSPPDHYTHRLLPKASVFMMFVKDEHGFANILRLISMYPWWNKRAKMVIAVKENSLLPTKGILSILDSEKIFNGIVITELAIKDNTTTIGSSNIDLQQQIPDTTNQAQTSEGNKTLFKSPDLQVVALDPYPLQGHAKESFVARWSNGELLTMRPIFEEKIANLRGHTLDVCVFEFPPLVIRKEVGRNKYEYTGLEVNLLAELARLLNFTYKFHEPPEGERWGADLGNNTWTGLIGETQRNADFGFASVFLLDNRDKAVDVSTPYDQDEGCFAVPRPEALQHWLGLVLPFSWQMWACIVSLALVAGPIFTFITRPLGMDKSLTIGRGIFYALGSLVSAQKAPHAKSHSLRFFIVAWLVFCWLACILYRVALIVSLTIGPNAFKINTLKQLSRSGLEWGGYPEVLKTFSNSSEDVDEDLFERFQVVTNVTEALDRVAIKGDFALLDSGKLLKYASVGKYFTGYSSMIHVTKECPTRYNVGIIMPIGSPFLEKVNELIRRLQNAGLIEKWYDRILHEAAVTNPNRKNIALAAKGRRERGLDIGDLKLCLVLILCGHFCAFLVLCGEHILDWYRTGKAAEIGSSIIRKVSTISGLSSLSSLASSKGLITSRNPSVIITDTDDQESCRTESLRSLPIEMEQEWCKCYDDERHNDPVSASLGDIKAVSCPHFKQFEEE